MRSVSEQDEEDERLKTLDEYRVSIRGEGHTLLNVLRYVIERKCVDVKLCGYVVPHPSEDVSVIRVEFKNEQSPKKVYESISSGCDGIVEISERLFKQIEDWDVGQTYERYDPNVHFTSQDEPL